MMQTTCPHCAAFADILSQVQQKYGDKVAIVAVASIPQDNAETVQKYIAGHRITYPVVFDSGQMQYSYVLKPRVDLPQVYVIDQSGSIRGDYGYGVTTRDIFEGKRLFTELDRVVGK
jgi:thiol-disulfide isomerase/thioredoxin